jgi:hypothetical protein
MGVIWVSAAIGETLGRNRFEVEGKFGAGPAHWFFKLLPGSPVAKPETRHPQFEGNPKPEFRNRVAARRAIARLVSSTKVGADKLDSG